MGIWNAMGKDGQAGGEYNDRRAQCEEGVRLLKRFFPEINALRDVTLPQLESHRADLSELIYRRCHHVISENERVLRTWHAFEVGDRAAYGPCMMAAHLSLQQASDVRRSEL